MKMTKRLIATTELLFIIPATLFMIALFMQEVQPILQTGHLVDWFSQHTILGLYVFLVAMPFSALVIGCIALLKIWENDIELRQTAIKVLVTVRAHIAMLIIAIITLSSIGILTVVALHMIIE